mmetsp:Transcript_53634/g.142448  ORF Transcript_53634/g.142448 Transcript_53634/m.142448 type:complete len:471 (+) Transcript_53634:130-1542(+)
MARSLIQYAFPVSDAQLGTSEPNAQHVGESVRQRECTREYGSAQSRASEGDGDVGRTFSGVSRGHGPIQPLGQDHPRRVDVHQPPGAAHGAVRQPGPRHAGCARGRRVDLHAANVRATRGAEVESGVVEAEERHAEDQHFALLRVNIAHVDQQELAADHYRLRHPVRQPFDRLCDVAAHVGLWRQREVVAVELELETRQTADVRAGPAHVREGLHDLPDEGLRGADERGACVEHCAAARVAADAVRLLAVAQLSVRHHEAPEDLASDAHAGEGTAGGVVVPHHLPVGVRGHAHREILDSELDQELVALRDPEADDRLEVGLGQQGHLGAVGEEEVLALAGQRPDGDLRGSLVRASLATAILDAGARQLLGVACRLLAIQNRSLSTTTAFVLVKGEEVERARVHDAPQLLPCYRNLPVVLDVAIVVQNLLIFHSVKPVRSLGEVDRGLEQTVPQGKREVGLTTDQNSRAKR